MNPNTPDEQPVSNGDAPDFSQNQQPMPQAQPEQVSQGYEAPYEAPSPSPIENSQPTEMPPEQPQVLTNTPITGFVEPSKSGGARKLFGGKKTPLIAALAAIVVLAGAAAAYFVILPNNPDYLWKKALSNTSKGYSQLVTHSEKRKDAKGASYSGTIKAEGDFATDGKIEGSTYENSSTFKADMGLMGGRIYLDVITLDAESSKNPDMYLKLKGIKGLGALTGETGYGELLDMLDDQWISIDHTLFDNLASSESDSASPPKAEDVIAIARAVGDVNNEYLFTTQKNKATFKIAEKVGEETDEGRKVYHYKVAYNKENLKKYVTALRDKLKEARFEQVTGVKVEDALSYDKVMKEIDELNESDTFDAWVDKKTMTLRKLRFTDKEDANSYIDLGLNYTGGKEFPFYFRTVSGSGESKSVFTLTVTLNTDKEDVGLAADIEQGANKVKVDVTAKPSDTPVSVQKPDGSIPITELLGMLFGGSGESLLEQPAGAEATINGGGSFDLEV